ncbi:MAG: tetratricopeptide repeat protein [bacterium]
MMKNLIIFSSLLATLFGCAGTNRPRTQADYQREIVELRAELKTTPHDAHLWRELGVAYFETRQYQAARKSFFQAFKCDKHEPKTLFYLGLAFEFDQRPQLALDIYASYGRLSRFSTHRGLMKARYYWLTRRMLQTDMRALLQQERQWTADSASTKAVAIFPLLYQGNNPEYAALSKGLAEMLITDLSQVKSLEVVDRVRVQALFDEMALAQSGLVDETTAAKFGSMIRAGKIVRGAYTVLNERQLRVDMAFWDVQKQQFPAPASRDDLLQNLFQLEKALVFQVIENMGIELTPAEQEKIQRLPTQNLRAFLYYCTGLAQEDAGDYAQAARSYLRAAELDPGFSWAVQKAELMEDLKLVSGEPEDVLNETLALEQPAGEEEIAENSLTTYRLDILEKNIDSNFEPGQDSRDATDSAFDLPLSRPPRPPQ